MKTTPLSLALAACFLSSGAQAATDAELLARIDRLAAELEAVKAELRSVKAQATPPAPVATTAATPPAATVPVPAAPGAYTQTASASSANPTSLFGYGEVNYNRPFRNSSDTRMDVRRAVIGVTHQASERTRIVGEFEFEHAVASATDSGEVEVEQLYVEHRLNDNVGLKGGLFLIPLGTLNLSHEPLSYYGVERNFVETAIIPTTWREVGLSTFGVTDEGLRWDVGLTSGFDLNKWDKTSDEGRTEGPLAAIHQEGSQARGHDLSVYAALDWRGTPGLAVGGGVFSGKASHKVNDPSTANAGVYAPGARVTLWDTHARWTPGKWDLAALYARGSISDTDQLNVQLAGGTPVPKSFFGWYTQAAYRLWENGEYKLSPFVRHERFNTGATYAAMPAGLEIDPLRTEKVLTAGANFQVGGNVVLKADVQRFVVDRSRDRLNLGLGYQF